MEIIFHHCIRRQRSYHLRVVGFITSVLFATSSASLAQEAPSEVEVIPNPTVVTVPADGFFFADVLVRGRPIFQVGSLPELSASRRAQIINPRIASILAREESLGSVIVQTNLQRNVATLQLNNRVLMTVTQQDSQDFGLDVTLKFRNSLTGSLTVQINPNSTHEHPNGQSSMEGEYFAK